MKRSTIKSYLKMFHILSVFSLILIIVLPLTVQSSPPSDGDWIVKDRQRVEHQSITLTGDLIIENSGELILNHVDLKFDINKDGEYKILVEDGGELEIRNSKINLIADYNIVLRVESEGNIDIYNSSLSNIITIGPDAEDFRSSYTFIMAGASILFLLIIVISVILMLLLFRKKIIYTEELRKMINNTGVVESTIIPGQFNGTVKIESEVKKAITKGSEKINTGEKVKVVDVQNFNLVVEKIK